MPINNICHFPSKNVCVLELRGSRLISRPMIVSEPQGILIPNVHDIIQVDYGRVVGWGVYSNIQDEEIHVDVWKRRSIVDRCMSMCSTTCTKYHTCLVQYFSCSWFILNLIDHMVRY